MSLFYLSSDLLETSANIVERPLLLSARKLKLHKEDIDSGNSPTCSLFCCRVHFNLLLPFFITLCTLFDTTIEV